jgi:hypothetical protein
VHRIATVALALLLAGCGAPPEASPEATRGEQVPLLTEVAPAYDTYPSFVNVVIDVVADPETGTPIIEFHGVPMRWPDGYTAWRVGSDTEVLDPNGNRVLVTGQRYRLYPGWSPEPYRIVAHVEPCPPPGLFGSTCVLGVHQQGDW